MFKRLTIQNFATYRGKHVLDFPQSGLISISGRNEISSSMNSNGVGKTSILNAIFWCIAGEPLRGGKLKKVACRHVTDPCIVSLEGESPAGPYLIERGQRPNFVRVESGGEILHNQDAPLPLIEKLLGFKVNSFRAGAVFSPAVEAFARFVTADHSEKIRILDEMNSYNFSEWEKNARSVLKTVSTAINEIDSKRITMESSLSSTEESLRVHRESKTRWKDSVTKQIDDLLQESAHIDSEMALLEKKKVELEKRNKQLAAYTKDKAAVRVLQKSREKIVSSLVHADEKQKTLALRLLKIASNLKNGTCPTCTQSVDSELLESIEKTLAEGIGKLEKEMKEHQEASSKLESEIDALELKWSTVLKTVGNTPFSSGVSYHLQTQISILQTEITQKSKWTERKKIVTDKIANLKKSKWDGADLEAKFKSSVQKIQASLSSLASDLDKYQKQEKLLKYWVAAFGDRGIRIDLLKDSAEFFSERMTYHLGLLTGGEALSKTAFETQRGRDTLIIQPIWEFGADEYDSASNGQDRRFDLASFAALQDLAESRTVFGFPIKAFDEPSDALDDTGKEMLASWIGEQASNSSRPVFVITHSAEFGSMLPTPEINWTVVLDENGSHVEVN